ncbi:MAG: pilus assembly protein [Cyanobacteria bacterium SZAS-4]|nr:pilus assembly protein [Cyanobacteria bacterium SZAS-4]
MIRNKTIRAAHGAVLAEVSASSALFLGVLMLITFALIQAAICLHIINGCQQASRQAAREAAILYMKSSGGQAPSDSSVNSELQKVLVPGVVNSTNQFSVVWPTSYPKNPHPPLTVTVTCTAAPGQAGFNGTPDNIGIPASLAIPGLGIVFSNGNMMKASTTYPLRP